MKFTKLIKIIFVLNNIFYLIGFVYKIKIYLFYFFINLFIIIFVIKRINKSEIIFVLIGLFTFFSEMLLSFYFDLFNPNFAISLSVLIYLSFRRLFIDLQDKLNFLLILLTAISILLIPYFNIHVLMFMKVCRSRNNSKKWSRLYLYCFTKLCDIKSF